VHVSGDFFSADVRASLTVHHPTALMFFLSEGFPQPPPYFKGHGKPLRANKAMSHAVMGLHKYLGGSLDLARLTQTRPEQWVNGEESFAE
jgi:hypothetical protein